MLSLPPDFAGKILVVRRDNIGDLICTTPFLDGLRSAWPRAHIAALVNSYNAPVLNRNPSVDRVYTYTKLKHREDGNSFWSSVMARLQLIGSLRAEKFDLAILARPGLDRHGLNLVRWLAIPRVMGFQPAGTSTKLLTDPVALPDKGLEHEVESVWCLMGALGAQGFPGPLRLFPAPATTTRIPSRGKGSPVIALHISAREESRRLPVAKWIRVIERLAAEVPDAVLGLFWSPGRSDDPRHPGDDDKAEAVLSGIDSGSESRVHRFPTTDLDQLMAAMNGCDLFIGADGGAMHVAVGLGLPTVGLFENSPFKLRHWAPWQVPCEQVPSPTFAIGDTDPDVIVAAALRLLARTRPAS